MSRTALTWVGSAESVQVKRQTLKTKIDKKLWKVRFIHSDHIIQQLLEGIVVYKRMAPFVIASVTFVL